jgi:hypothetical protein
MSKIEEIKQQIIDFYEEPNEPLSAAFDSLVSIMSWRRGEVTLPSGVAKLYSLDDEKIIFWVGDTLFCVEKDPDETVDGVTYYTKDWKVDDMYEVKPVNKTVVDFERVD